MSKLWASTCFCALSIAFDEPAVLDDLALLHAHRLHEPRDALGPEDAHQVVLERQVEAATSRGRPGGRRGRAAGCRCGATRAARCRGCRGRRRRRPPRARLAVCACAAPPAAASRRLRPLAPCARGTAVLLARPSIGASGSGPDLVLRHHLRVAAEEDVGAAAGHVGGDGDRALAARLRDDLGLALVLLGVEHVVRHAAPLEERRRRPRSSRSRRCRPGPAAPSRAASRSPRRWRRTSRARSCRRRPRSPCGPSCGSWGRRGRRGCRSSRTPRPRCRRCRSCRRASSTCGSSSGTRSVASVWFSFSIFTPSFASTAWWRPSRPAAARHEAAGELVDDEDLAFLHHVVATSLVEGVRAQGLLDVVEGLDLLGRVEVRRLASRFCIFSMPASVSITERRFSSTVSPGPGSSSRDDLVDLVVLVGRRPRSGPEMMSGVRASSMRIESTSSTMAKLSSRCT